MFQPHRYSRVALLKKEFANAFIDSDLVVLCPIYAASEKPIKNINSSIFLFFKDCFPSQKGFEKLFLKLKKPADGVFHRFSYNLKPFI